MNDYIAYIDTDSLFIKVEEFILDQGVSKEHWDSIPDDQRIKFVKRISAIVEKHVDDEAFYRTQLETYNSSVERDDFAIRFKQEIVCKSALFIRKKKYGYHLVDEEGTECDKIDVTGLEIIRSETPAVFREALKDLLSMILKNASDEDIRAKVSGYKKSMAKASHEDLSSNVSVNNISQYIIDGKHKKGTPWHIKGANNYHILLKEFDLEDKYERLIDGDKAKIVYIKPNPWDMATLAYYEWPKEFTDIGLSIDYKKQLEKFFLRKVEYLLEPQNRQNIIREESAMALIFGV